VCAPGVCVAAAHDETMSGRDDRMTFTQNFISGGIAGVVSRTITSPLDVVKILTQVGTPETQHGFRRTFVNLYRHEGIKAFWKGNGMAALRLFPYNAVQFARFISSKCVPGGFRFRVEPCLGTACAAGFAC